MTEQPPSGLESTIEYLKRRFHANRKAFFWAGALLVLAWVAFAVKEVTSLLLLSYVLALLLDPPISRLERKGISRSLSLFALYMTVFLLICAALAFVIPALLNEYSTLIEVLPDYIRAFVVKLQESLTRWPALQRKLNPDEAWNAIREYSALVGPEHLKRVGSALGETLLSGYSITLTVLNLTLLPFFVYYLTSDLSKIHAFLGSFLPRRRRLEIAEVGEQIRGHVYVFFKGQLTVACILTLFYILGLLLIGLPSAIVVGLISGLLSVVPYLGVATGIVLSLVITVVTDPGWWPVLKVLIVFSVVQTLEGTVLTPRIVGESLGIHPLGVMLALIIGGQLLGLLGLIIAIPAAAALRVLFRSILNELNEPDRSQDERLIVHPS